MACKAAGSRQGPIAFEHVCIVGSGLVEKSMPDVVSLIASSSKVLAPYVEVLLEILRRQRGLFGHAKRLVSSGRAN